MSYQVSITRPALKALAAIDKTQRRRIQAAIDRLADNPRPPGARALRGRSGELRIRVGDYRVIYDVYDDQLLVLVVEVGHRREIYR